MFSACWELLPVPNESQLLRWVQLKFHVDQPNIVMQFSAEIVNFVLLAIIYDCICNCERDNSQKLASFVALPPRLCEMPLRVWLQCPVPWYFDGGHSTDSNSCRSYRNKPGRLQNAFRRWCGPDSHRRPRLAQGLVSAHVWAFSSHQVTQKISLRQRLTSRRAPKNSLPRKVKSFEVLYPGRMYEITF